MFMKPSSLLTATRPNDSKNGVTTPLQKPGDARASLRARQTLAPRPGINANEPSKRIGQDKSVDMVSLLIMALLLSCALLYYLSSSKVRKDASEMRRVD
jgi:hypothetical protein